MVHNKSLVFAQVPSGLPVEGRDLIIEDHPIDIDSLTLPNGGLLLKTNYFSLDPYLRGRMRDPNIKSYSPPFTLGKPITSHTIATVLKSSTDKFKAGQLVTYVGNFEEYSVLDEKAVQAVKTFNNPSNLDPKLFIGALGMPGLTAYSSLYDIGKPQKGETILVSAASGAVGAIVGQLAKREGLKVIGSVGDERKLRYITQELGFDAGFIYKSEKPSDALVRLAPDGLDIYYDNVGGEHLDAALPAMNNKGRIVICGMISEYNSAPEDVYGIKNLSQVLRKRLTMRGFIVGDPDMGPRYAEDHQRNVQQWLKDGSFKAMTHTTKGFDHAVESLLELFSGKNFGKAILEVAPVDHSS